MGGAVFNGGRGVGNIFKVQVVSTDVGNMKWHIKQVEPF